MECGEDETSHRTERRALGRRGKAEEDRAEYEQNECDDRDEPPKDQGQHLRRRDQLAHLPRQHRSESGLEPSSEDEVREVEPCQREARYERPRVETRHGHAGDEPVQDQKNARRYEDAERPGGCHRARGILAVVARLHHRRERE